MPAGEAVQHHRLGVRGVLILVDEHVPVLVVEPVEHVAFEDLGRLGEQGAVVEEVPVAERGVVTVQEGGQPAPVVPAHLGERLGPDQLLPAPQDEVGDFVGEGPCGEQPSVGEGPVRWILGGEEDSHQALLVGSRQHLGWAIPAPGPGVRLEETAGKGVIGGDVDGGHGASDGVADAGVQVGCTASREGEHQQALTEAALDQVGRSPHQELGLAGAGTADHELGTVGAGEMLRPLVGRDPDLGVNDSGSGGS